MDNAAGMDGAAANRTRFWSSPQAADRAAPLAHYS